MPKNMEGKTPNITCKKCGRGAFEDQNGRIICSNCLLEENSCQCNPLEKNKVKKKEQDRLFLISVSIHPEFPDYVFLLKGKNENEVRRKAKQIVDKDYGGIYFEKDFSVWEIFSLEDIKNLLLLN